MIGFATLAALACGWPHPVHLLVEAPDQIGPLTVYRGAGDVDGDGFEDLIVGASTTAIGTTIHGWVGIFAGGPRPRLVWSRLGADGERLGSVVAGIGDVDGDGLGDFALGVPNDPAGGRVEVYLGGAGGLGQTPRWVDRGGSGFGAAIAGVGDIDGDGRAEVAIAADNGRVTVHRGMLGGLEASVYRDVAGHDVGWAGDLDGDGHADLVVGDTDGVHIHVGDTVVTLGPGTFAGIGDVDGDGRMDLGIARDGELWLVRRRATAVLLAEVATGIAAERVAAAGDMNGDGYADLVVVHDGKASFVIGGTTLRAVAALRLPEASDVAGIGDLDGDGFGDVGYTRDGASAMSVVRGAGTALGSPSLALETPHRGVGIKTSLMWAIDGSDLDADGFSDVIVGMRSADDNTGRVDIFRGRDLSPTATWSFTGRPQDRFGTRVVGGGDVDGDGFSDFWVGAPEAKNGNLLEAGYLQLYQGGISAPTATRRIGGGIEDKLGLGGMGDLDGDGRADLAYNAVNGEMTVHFGAATRPALKIIVLVTETAPGRPIIGDIDGDGRDEVIANGPFGIGRLVAWLAGGALDHQVIPPSYGLSVVASAGDIDGDGDIEVVESDMQENCWPRPGGYTTGLLAGRPGFTLDPLVVLGSPLTCAGKGIDGAGDVDGDGLGDLILGSPSFNADGLALAGEVVVHLGTRNGLAREPAWRITGDRAERGLGLDVGGVGDVDGDGFADVAVATALTETGQPIDSLVRIYFGNGGLGTRSAWRYGVAARQPIGQDPLAIGGRSRAPDAFALRAFAASPYGRRVRLEVEAKPHGTAFDGLGVVVSGWGEVGDEILTTVTGLAVDTGYAWRARLRTAPSEGPRQATSHWIYGGRPGEPRAVHVRTRTNAAPTATSLERRMGTEAFILPPPGLLGLANDPDEDALTTLLGRPPINGVAVVLPNGQLTYKPDPGFGGIERFTYVVSDGFGGQAEADVTLTVGGPDGCGFVSDEACAQGDVFLVVRKVDDSLGSVHCTISALGVPACDREAGGTLRIGAPACGL